MTDTNPALVATSDIECQQKAADISQRISLLNDMAVEDLRGEMSALKRAILDNPAACSLLKDEDIGKLVESLRRVTGQALISAASKTKSKTPKEKKAKVLSAAELNDALSALDDEDF